MLLLTPGAAAPLVAIAYDCSWGCQPGLAILKGRALTHEQDAGAEMGQEHTGTPCQYAHHGKQGGIQHLLERLHDVKHLLP